RDRLCVRPAVGTLVAGRPLGFPGNVPDSVLGTHLGRRQEVGILPRPLRHGEPRCTLARTLPAGHSLDHRAGGSALRPRRSGAAAGFPGILPAGLRTLRADLSYGVPTARNHYTP